MVNDLLVEKGSRVEDFLASHKNIQWIKKIEKGEYKMALEILKAMSSEEPDSRKKLVIFLGFTFFTIKF
jgi:hypothetical protein